MVRMLGIFGVAVMGGVLTAAWIVLSPRPHAVPQTAPSSSLALATDTQAEAALLISTPVPPKAAPKAPSFVGTTTAVLAGTVSPHGLPASYWFEYSADPALGAVLAKRTPRVALATTTGVVPIGMGVVGLAPSTTYYFRVVVQSPTGIVRSATSSLLTK